MAATMVRFTQSQRAVLAEKLPDLANLFAGGFVVGPFLSERPVSGALIAVGFLMWAVLMLCGIWAAKEAQ